MSKTPVADAIRARLTAAFAPIMLELQDESAKHRGHAGHSGAGESHFRLKLQATAFDGKSRLQRQQMVYAALGALMGEPVHALAMTVLGSVESQK